MTISTISLSELHGCDAVVGPFGANQLVVNYKPGIGRYTAIQIIMYTDINRIPSR